MYFSASAIEGIDILQKMKALYMIIPHILPANQVNKISLRVWQSEFILIFVKTNFLQFQVLPHDVYKTPEEQVSTTVSFKIN